MENLHKENIFDAKTLITIRKRFLSDVMTTRKNFTPQTLGNIISKIDRFGKKELLQLYKQVKNIMYGKIKNMSLKRDRAERVNVLFPFADDLFMNENNAIDMYGTKQSTIAFKRVAKAIEMDLRTKKYVESKDIDVLKKHIKKAVFANLTSLLSDLRAMKVVFALEMELVRDVLDENGEIREDKVIATFSSASIGGNQGQIILNANQYQRAYDNAFEKITADMEAFILNGSDWRFNAFKRFFIKAIRYQAFNGASYIELPEWVKNKKAVINIKNNDNKCFMYSVLCGLHLDDIKKDHQRVTKYKDYENELKFDDIEFPVSIDDIEKFEKLNQISINVFILNDKFDKDDALSQHFEGVYFHKIKNEKKPINLLLIEDDDKSHYCFIKNLRGFVRNDNRENLVVCDECLRAFRLNSAYDNHKKLNKCQVLEANVKVLPNPNKPSPRTNKIDSECHLSKFKNSQKQLKVPFVIYADGESILNKVEKKEGMNTQVYQSHQVYNLGCKFVSEFPDILNDEYKEFTGEDCMIDFLNYVFKMQDKVLEIVASENQIPMNLTNAEETLYQANNKCHICKKNISGIKVRDHCHLTGKFRGPACESCNINYNYKNFKLPVVFHNLKGYDSHFILQYVGRLEKKQISVIPNTMEKYLSFTIDKCVFLDSLQFLNASLESLIEALDKSKDEKLFSHFNTGFNTFGNELKDLLRQKGVFPYDWYDSKNKLTHNGLPTKDKFYNELNECGIEDVDFVRAQNVYNLAKCKNFGDYLSLYLKCDVLLLADVFEAFRLMCIKNYDLDPCHYFTSPGFSWDAMLKMTDAKIECFQEGQEDMLEMIEKNMRGGVSMISNRYAKANNKYMKEYNPNEPSSYIMYLDANNLYGWAMSQYLPTGNYKWENIDTFTNDYILNIKSDSDKGYIFDVDLDVPSELHDYFNDYPLAPENRVGEYSPKMIEKYKIIHDKAPTNTVPKLIPNLNDKKNYTLHYRNLQLYLKLGLKLKTINKVLSFDQEPYLEKYIGFNTKKRAETKNDYEKDLFKLMNNSVFGKTMENVAKRIDVKLMTDEKKFVRQCSMPSFKDFRIFTEGLVAVQMAKTQVVYNRPMIVGFCILELSKVLMYDFHYNTMTKKYGDDIKLLFTDTDSLCYHITTEDIFDDMKDNLNMYDTSDYPKEHQCYSTDNKKVIGKFKDECNSKPMIEFCGHRAKMYCFLTEEKCKSVAKGIKRNQIKKLKMEQYKKTLFGETRADLKHTVSFNLLRSTNHQMNSIRVTKTGLSAIDDKRYIKEDNVTSYAHGHYKIKNTITKLENL